MILETIEHAMKMNGKTWTDLEKAVYGKETRSLSQSLRKWTKRTELLEKIFDELNIELFVKPRTLSEAEINEIRKYLFLNK